MAEAQGPFYPVEIQRDDQGMMRVLWNDGRECHYAYSDLRKSCPCATCRDLRAQQQIPPTDPFQTVTTVTTSNVKPIHLSAVGNYALNIEWDDGHHTGIYPWGLLRAMCEHHA